MVTVYTERKYSSMLKSDHKNYDVDTTNNDIALLKLKTKIDFSKYGGTVSPVCLPAAPRKYYGKEASEG